MRWGPLLAASFGLVACGEEDVTSAGSVTVRFEYRASIEVDGDTYEAHRACADLVGRTHLHPSWERFRVVLMRPEAERLWSLTFRNVPAGTNSLRVSDPNACVDNSTGAVVRRRVYANEVRLERSVPTPGSGGTEPGWSFSVDPDGTVTP